jgi:hypothetical protein
MFTNKEAIENDNEIENEIKDNEIYEISDIIKNGKQIKITNQKILNDINQLLHVKNNNRKLSNFLKNFNNIDQETIYKIFTNYEIFDGYNSDYIKFTLGNTEQQVLSCNTYIDYTLNKIKINLQNIFQGMLINHSLHQILPHFVITYGYKIAGPIYIQNKFPKNVLAVTSHNEQKGKYVYVYYEKVSGVYFKDLLAKLSVEDFINIWYQLLFLLEVAQEESSFMYNGNLYDHMIIEQLDDFINLPYRINLLTKNLIRIEKYNSVTQDIKINHIRYNSYDANRLFNSYRDIYNFLGRLSVAAFTYNRELVPLCRLFMQYFNNKDSLEDIIQKQYKESFIIFYYANNEESINKKSFSKFIDYCMNIYKITTSKKYFSENIIEKLKWQNLNNLITFIDNYSDNNLIKSYQARASFAIKNIEDIVMYKQYENIYVYADLYYKLLTLKNLPQDLINILNYKDQLLLLVNNFLNNKIMKMHKRDYFKELTNVLKYTLLIDN